jgi:hypothetical protein
MIWFNSAKDHGFIRTEEDERLLVTGDGFAAGEKPDGRCASMAVTFQIEENGDGERHARNVVFEQEVAARRARLRGGGRIRG